MQNLVTREGLRAFRLRRTSSDHEIVAPIPGSHSQCAGIGSGSPWKLVQLDVPKENFQLTASLGGIPWYLFCRETDSLRLLANSGALEEMSNWNDGFSIDIFFRVEGVLGGELGHEVTRNSLLFVIY